MTDKDFMGYTPSTGGNYECLPEGPYDFVIHGIVGLGLRPHSFEGKDLAPRAEIKVIFEIPDQKREDGQTELLSIRFPISTNSKSHYYKFCSAVLGERVTSNEEQMNKLGTAAGMRELLGKTATLTVVTWKDGMNRSVSNKGFYPLHPKAPKPEATRDAVFFNPFNPDVKIFKENLTFYTRKQIMEALNADSFSDELKAAYKETQAADSAKQGDKKETKAKDSEGAPWDISNAAIQ